MNIFVLIKQVPDTETKIRISNDKKGIEKGDIKWIINPYDEFAIEEALKNKEKLGGTVTVVTCGPDRCVEALRTAIAMGADNATHVKSDTDDLDSFAVARALAAYLKKESPSLIYTGKQAIDDDQAAAFGMVAELLGLPSASVVVKAEIGADKQSIRLERDVEGGTRYVIQSPLPCVLALDKGINTPRYASLPGIMKAKKKEIKTLTFAELGIDTAKTTEDGDYQLPPERSAGKKIPGDAAAQAKELVRLLREEAKVI